MPDPTQRRPPLRHKPKFEELRPTNHVTRPVKPELTQLPSPFGLDKLERQFTATAITVSSQEVSDNRVTSPRGNSSWPRKTDGIARLFNMPSPKSQGIPRRKPVPAGLSGIPVYDNGTDAAYRNAQNLKKAATSAVNNSARVNTPGGWAQLSTSNEKTPMVKNGKSTLCPAPLNISKTRMPTSSPRATERYINRPLPATPRHVSSRFHDSDLRTPPPRTPNQEDALKLYQRRQASHQRVNRAKQAFDDGKWTGTKTCAAFEALTRGERQIVNDYIQQKRDQEKRRRDEELRKTAARLNENGFRTNEKQKRKGKSRCVVM